MKDGVCPRCNSKTVFKKVNGVISESKHIYVRGITMLTPRSDRTSYVCTSCGYYENYIDDPDLLAKIGGKWEKA
jgi:DNA-directed RNA polymerase subunit RPC12/RpoP